MSTSSTAIARSALGRADVSDSDLAGIIAVAHGVSQDRVELLTAVAEVAPYDLEALMTAGRYWVHGTCRIDAQVRSFRIFVKHVQSVARSPILEMAPPPMLALLLDQLPWETEPRIYRSDLASRLPPGLAMPAAYAVRDLDEDSAALWLEAVPSVATTWDVERFARAAYLLGRLAAQLLGATAGPDLWRPGPAHHPRLRRRTAGPRGAATTGQRRPLAAPGSGWCLRRRVADSVAGRRRRRVVDRRGARDHADRHEPW